MTPSEFQTCKAALSNYLSFMADRPADGGFPLPQKRVVPHTYECVSPSRSSPS
nr:hypothetical protein Q903MT_gene544 [Picea sitchensis]